MYLEGRSDRDIQLGLYCCSGVGALWDRRNDAYCVCLYCWIVVDGFLDVNKIRFEINKYVSFVQKGSANSIQYSNELTQSCSDTCLH
jgi:hypothetical protein